MKHSVSAGQGGAPMLSRRLFLSTLGYSGTCFALGSLAIRRWTSGTMTALKGTACCFSAEQAEDLIKTAPKARYWISALDAKSSSDCLRCHDTQDPRLVQPAVHKDKVVKCLLCPQACLLKAGERGRCRARLNLNGELRSLVYGRPVTFQLDPIEKKPFCHFLPGAAAYSIATSGCPLRCRFCQNWQISQSRPEDFRTSFTPPSEIVTAALSRQAGVIAFTYNEPTVFTEYLTDIARIARTRQLRCALVSCGFINAEPLKEMCGVLSAIKIDLKGFSKDFYRNVCGAELHPVLRSIKQISRSGTHLEIVNLVVPTLNDSSKMLEGLAEWIMGEIGPDVPIHFTRFHPEYQMQNLPPTPVSTLERAREIALRHGIHYAFVGNVPNHPGNHTYCPNCHNIVIKRTGFFLLEKHLKGNRCLSCGTKIAGVWA